MSVSPKVRGYLCAGKTHWKFTLLGKPGNGIAAVIVEANRFAYVYHETSPSQSYGKHQVMFASPPFCMIKNHSGLYASCRASFADSSVTVHVGVVCLYSDSDRN